ncbi:MAG: hypothetical protein PCFJNLEI_03378 [Verrucomicrobiae bacterium]|nr:hypothetical protein [Verrucomicrobiae bacterium]
MTHTVNDHFLPVALQLLKSRSRSAMKVRKISSSVEWAADSYHGFLAEKPATTLTAWLGQRIALD